MGYAALRPPIALEEPTREARPLEDLMPSGRLVELCGRGASARTSAAVSLVAHVQSAGELVAWIQPEEGPLYPPDLEVSGVDLSSLLCIHVPKGDRRALVRAAELLVRSGALGLVVIDMTGGAPEGSLRWQGRLQGLLRTHDTRMLVLTKSEDGHSLGPLVGLRIEARRERMGARYAIHHTVRKAKIPLAAVPEPSYRRAPVGVP